MKRKFYSSLLMGLLVLGTSGMVTSCKDYDDEVNNLQTQIDALTPLKNVKSELVVEINNLKTQLEKKDAELAALLTQLQTATNENKDAIAKEVIRATAAESALEGRLKSADEALLALSEALKGDTTVEELKNLQAKLETVSPGLSSAMTQIVALKQGLDDEVTARKAVAEDVAQQQIVLDGFQKRLEALEKQGLSAADLQKINDQIKTVKDALQAQIDKNTGDIDQLKKDMQNLSNAVDQLKAEVNVLNVLVRDDLRSLVFIPDSYYVGVEATTIQTLNFWNYKLPVAAWNKIEAKGYTDMARYDSIAGSSVLAFVANYHMNPSNAVLDADKVKVDVLSNDLVYDDGNTRAAAAGLSVIGWETKDGMLKVSLDVTNPNLIKSVKNDQMITNFATQVTLRKAQGNQKDTTITSDYATLRAEAIKDLKIAHRAGDDVPWLGVESNHASVLTGPDVNHKHHNLLMQTAFEAKERFLSQDSVNYNDSLDLTKLVEIHYTTSTGQRRLMTADELKANGMSYKFEMTALYYGDNETSESAHAAINPKDGKTFRPQMPEYDADRIGKQQAYGAPQDRQEIGRTPLVRVSLLDKNGKVLDYGYIRIKITEKKRAAEIKPDKFISYQGSDWNYVNNGECVDPVEGWKYETKWIQTEYDLYNMLGMTREEFEANYGTSPVIDDVNGDLQQYRLSANGKTFEKAPVRFGSAYTRNETSAEDHTLTSILGWKMTAAEAKEYFVTKKMNSVTVAVKYESKDKASHPDVYVQFTANKGTITTTAPAGTINWANSIINNYWYASNTSTAGTDEIHTNTLTPEDNAGGTADAFDNALSDVFMGNKIAAATLINVTKDLTANKEYAASKLTLNVVFDKSNNGKEYKGIDGKTYVMSVSDDGKTLSANIKGSTTKQPVAVLDSPADPSDTKITYQHGEYAEALLNYKAHNALANDVIKAIVGIQAVNECNKVLPLTENTFDVRFLRPLNAYDAAKTIEDANIVELQVIKAQDLLYFTDWRDAWNNVQYPAGKGGQGGAYYDYYGITGITIEGVADGQTISLNPDVTTNLGQANATTFVPLQTVTNKIDFVYSAADGGTLTYKNLSSTVQEFQVKIPVTVRYIWGYITKDVTITVKKSANNAKKF